MKIAIVASIWISVPPKGYGFGAQEYLAYYIAKILKEKGHDVTLFASGDSHTDAKLISVTPNQVCDMNFPDPKLKDMFELMNLSEAYKYSKDFDIIHNHLLPYGLLFANQNKTPIVHTLHHAIYKTRADIFLYQKYKNQNYISISNAQRKIVPELNYIDTVYNGIDPNFYKFKAESKGEYLLFLGRMKKYKGIHTAIEIAKRTDLKLKIASPMPNKNQSDYREVMGYYDKEIAPNVGENIEYINGVEGDDKIKLLQNAKALISPIERDEPFGMTVIEAMACGTPVIAYIGGAAAEIIKDGETGYLIPRDDKNGLVDAVKNIDKIDRHKCRELVENKFSVEKMVDNYEKIYKKYAGLK